MSIVLSRIDLRNPILTYSPAANSAPLQRLKNCATTLKINSASTSKPPPPA